MYLRLKRILISLSCLLLFMVRLCGNAVSAAEPAPTAAQWKQLTSDKAFSYATEKETIKPPKPNNSGFVERFLYALFEFFYGPGRVLLWLIVIAAVAFVVYKLLFSKDSILFGRSGKKMSGDKLPVVEEEDIAATNWEALLQEATRNNDDRLAIRYSYMWLLQLLQHRRLIAYSSDKTNYDYFTELGDSVYKQPFRQLSRLYEYVWYGRFTLPPADMGRYMASFHDLKKQLRG